MWFILLKKCCILITDQKRGGGNSGEIVNSVMFYRCSRQALHNSPFKITTLWIHQTELRHSSAISSLHAPTPSSWIKSGKWRVYSQHLPGNCPENRVLKRKLGGAGCDKGVEFYFCCYAEAYGFHPQENLLLGHTKACMKEKDFAVECISMLGTCH